MKEGAGSGSNRLRLFDALVNQSATETELAALYEQLESSVELRQEFLEYCQLHIDLSFELCANQACDSFLNCLLWADELTATIEQNPSTLSPRSALTMKSERSINPVTTGWQSAWRNVHSWAAFPLVFLIGVLSTLVWTRYADKPEISNALAVATDPQPYVPLPGEAVVAQLVSNTGFVFDVSDGKHSIELESGAALRPEQLLNIPRGVAHLTFSEGADLQLEGPVVLRIDSLGVPELRYGKLFAKSQWGLEGFAIETELGTIWLDGDDAVGITLHGKDLQIHGFDGEADVTFKDDILDSQTVSRGKLLRRMLMPDGTLKVSEKEYVPELFSSRFTIQDDSILVTQQYADTIREAKPLCYWRFEKIEDGYVPNEMSQKHPLRVKGAASIVPLSPGNHVMDFGYGESGGYLIDEEPFTELIDSDYTFETWVKPGHAQWGTIAALAQRRSDASDKENHAMILEMTGLGSIRSVKSRLNSFRFLHRAPPGDRGGASCISGQDYLFHKWQYLAAVRNGSTVCLFVDGKPVDRRQYPAQLEDELELVIGQLFSFDTIRPLVGQLDEFAIYDRALTPAEVTTHYTLLRPTKKTAKSKPK